MEGWCLGPALPQRRTRSLTDFSFAFIPDLARDAVAKRLSVVTAHYTNRFQSPGRRRGAHFWISVRLG